MLYCFPQLIAEEEDGERRTQAKIMSEEQRQKRLADLKDARQEWRDGGKTMANEEEQLHIFQVSVDDDDDDDDCEKIEDLKFEGILILRLVLM